jgi:hypothetical protein
MGCTDRHGPHQGAVKNRMVIRGAGEGSPEGSARATQNHANATAIIPRLFEYPDCLYHIEKTENTTDTAAVQRQQLSRSRTGERFAGQARRAAPAGSHGGIMERKQFLRVSLCLGAFGGVRQAQGEEPTSPNPCEAKAEFGRRLLTRFMTDMDAQLDEPRRVALMEARGRSCARLGPARLAEAHKGNLDAFIADFGRHMGPDGLRREGNVIKVKYPTCYCPLASEIKETLSPTYCNCSVGWLKEMYETVTGKPVRVEVLETVKRGGQACRFNVNLTA